MHTPARFDTWMPYLLLAWVGIGAVAFAFFRRSHNPRLKRAVWNALVVVGNLAFVIAAAWFGAPWYVMLLALGVAAVGSYRSIRMTYFCAACGAHHFPMQGAVPPVNCQQCGLSLDAPPRTPTAH